MQGLNKLKIPADRAVKEAELNASEEELCAAIETVYMRTFQQETRTRYAALLTEKTETVAMLNSIASALRQPLRQRLELVLAQRLAALRAFMLLEVNEQAERSSARIAQLEQQASVRSEEKAARAAAEVRQREDSLQQQTRIAAAEAAEALSALCARTAAAEAAEAATQRAANDLEARVAAFEARVAEHGPRFETLATADKLQALEASLQEQADSLAKARAQLDIEAAHLPVQSAELESLKVKLEADRVQLAEQEVRCEFIRIAYEYRSVFLPFASSSRIVYTGVVRLHV